MPIDLPPLTTPDDLAAEVQARATADTIEAKARSDADAALDARLKKLEAAQPAPIPVPPVSPWFDRMGARTGLCVPNQGFIKDTDIPSLCALGTPLRIDGDRELGSGLPWGQSIAAKLTLAALKQNIPVLLCYAFRHYNGTGFSGDYLSLWSQTQAETDDLCAWLKANGITKAQAGLNPNNEPGDSTANWNQLAQKLVDRVRGNGCDHDIVLDTSNLRAPQTGGDWQDWFYPLTGQLSKLGHNGAVTPPKDPGFRIGWHCYYDGPAVGQFCARGAVLTDTQLAQVRADLAGITAKIHAYETASGVRTMMTEAGCVGDTRGHKIAWLDAVRDACAAQGIPCQLFAAGQSVMAMSVVQNGVQVPAPDMVSAGVFA